MLTTDDLLQIKNLIRDEIEPIKKETKGLKSLIKSEISKVRKDLNLAIKLFDNDIYDIRERVDRIENHLDIPPIKN